jgi:phospholipase/carboxylesterase
MSRPPIEIETAPNPTATVIVMHGLGADGNDFVPIAGELDLSGVGAVRFVFPNAPVIPVTINGGYQMPAWYDIAVADLAVQEDEAPACAARRPPSRRSSPAKRPAASPPSRIVVAGFSQGCAMSLMTGLRHTERLAGIVGLSGWLPLAATTAAERHAANHDTPVFLGHGRQDPVVPDAAAQRNRATRWPRWATPSNGMSTRWRIRCAWKKWPT